MLGPQSRKPTVFFRAGVFHVQPIDGQRGEGGLLPLVPFVSFLYPFLIPLSLCQLYHNTLEQKECAHTNAAAAKATSALETQNKNKAANEYSQPRSATESKELETSAEEEKLLKPDAQRC